MSDDAPPPPPPEQPRQPYQPYPPFPPPGPGPVSRLTPAQERAWASAAHWSALVAGLLALAFLGPLIVLLTRGNDSAVVRRHAVESLNFQISILVYGLISAALVLLVIGIVLLVAVGICWLVFTIIGAVRAGNGEDFHYPLTIHFVH